MLTVKFGKYAKVTIDGNFIRMEHSARQTFRNTTRQELSYSVIKDYFKSEYVSHGVWNRVLDAINTELAESIAEEAKRIAELNKGESTLVNYYECNGAISLDKEYLEGLANGKGEVIARCESLPAELIDELLEANKRVFDADEYYQMLEDGHTNTANYYWEQNHKCISTPRYGFNW